MKEEIFEPIKDFVLVDIETTGLDPKVERITEISALKVIDLKVAEVFTTFVNPGIPIPEHITEMTGITDEMVCDAPYPEEAVSDFLDFAGDFVLAGQNIRRFDFGFIYKVAEEDLGIEVENDFIDSLTLAKAFLPDLPSRSLQSLAAYYNVSYEGAHRAEADCYITLEVLKNLFMEFENPNVDYRYCPHCGKFLWKRKGKYGLFYGCMGYPECRYTEDV